MSGHTDSLRCLKKKYAEIINTPYKFSFIRRVTKARVFEDEVQMFKNEYMQTVAGAAASLNILLHHQRKRKVENMLCWCHVHVAGKETTFSL